MKTLTLGVKATALLVMVSMVPMADAGTRDYEVQREEKTYEIRYENGNTDMFVYVFSAHVKASIVQLGQIAKGLRLIDTRKCRWSVETRIERTGFFIKGDGERISYDPLKTVITSFDSEGKRRSFFSNLLGKHSPCTDHFASFHEMEAIGKASIIDAFKTFTTTELDPTKESRLTKAIAQAEEKFKGQLVALD